MLLVHPELSALRLAFRIALLDAVPRDRTIAQRCAALEAARDRMADLLLLPDVPAGLPRAVAAVGERAVLAAALQGGFEEAWAIVTQFPL